MIKNDFKPLWFFEKRENVMTTYPKSVCMLHQEVKTSEPVCIICMAAHVEELETKLEKVRVAWQRECDNPSGRFEDRKVFYDVFAHGQKGGAK